MLAADNDNDVVTISYKNEQTIELLDAHDCTERHVISNFVHIVDVPGDGNCGFYAIMTLLVKRNVITDELTVTDLSQKINDYILENVDAVIKTLEYATQFRNTSFTSK